MPVYTIYALAENEMTISDGAELSGFTQGDASHLQDVTITLNSNAWEPIDIFDTEADFNDSDTSQTLEGAQTFGGTSYADGLVVEAEYTLTVEDPDGNFYTLIGFNINEPGQSPAYGTVEGLAFIGGVGEFPPIGVPLTVRTTGEGPAGSATPFESYATPPCFVAGTLIDTPGGARPIEEIDVGDLVTTRDHGAQAVIWAGRTVIDLAAFEASPALRPVRIRRDAFGRGAPARDLCVSPQHRILLSGWRADLFCGLPEVLAAAKHLLGHPNVDRPAPTGKVVYHHLMCAAHEIIYAEGLVTESFRAGPETLKSLDPADRDRLIALRPDLMRGVTDRPVRPLIGAREAVICAG